MILLDNIHPYIPSNALLMLRGNFLEISDGYDPLVGSSSAHKEGTSIYNA